MMLKRNEKGHIIRNSKGFTLVEIMIVVAIIGLLAAIAVPNFVQARTSARRNACINNLRLVEAAKEQTALENNLATGAAVVAADIDPYMKGTTAAVICPADGAQTFATSYAINVVGTNADCNIDATHTL